MRSDWIPLSASALVIGVMALVFGSLLNPLSGDATQGETLRAVAEDSGRYLGMSVMYFAAAVAMTLGLPSVLSLFTTKGRKIGLAAVGIFTIGVIGTAGYAMLLVFFRALVNANALDSQGLDAVTTDRGMTLFLYSWIGGFYLGLLLVGIALFVAKRTPLWVPILLVVFVAMFPITSQLGRVAQMLQVMLLAVAFTGIAIAAVTQVHEQTAAREPSY